MKILQGLFCFLLFFSLAINVSANSVEKIDIINSKQGNIEFDSGLIFSKKTNISDIKILQDLSILEVIKSVADEKKLVIHLKDELKINTQYSILPIIGPKGGIDFSTSHNLINQEIQNEFFAKDGGIKTLLIKDSKTLALFYGKDVDDDEFIFKVLSDFPIHSITPKNNTLGVMFEGDVETYTHYMFMILSLRDANEDLIEFKDDIVNFQTKEFPKYETPTPQQNIFEPVQTAVPPILENKKQQEDEGNIEHISLEAKTTPPTGPATHILVLIACILYAGILLRRKF